MDDKFGKFGNISIPPIVRLLARVTGIFVFLRLQWQQDHKDCNKQGIWDLSYE